MMQAHYRNYSREHLPKALVINIFRYYPAKIQ